MRKPREEISTLKLRTTLQQLKQFSTRHPLAQPLPLSRAHLQSAPVGITLVSLQPYRSKRRAEQRSHRENIENELKLEIFKKIRETMQSRLNYNGLEIAKVTMHCSRGQGTAEKGEREARRRRAQEVQAKSHQNRCLRTRTENSSTYRPYESTSQPYANHYSNSRKPVTSERRFRTQRCENQEENGDLNGWNFSNEEEDFCPRA